jgi:hypothetical protein
MQIPSRVVVAILLAMVSLLVLVVVVGLARNQVDTNGLAIVLTPVITGILLGYGIRGGRSNQNDDDRS